MPINRPLLADSRGRLYIDAKGHLAHADCCCQTACPCPEELTGTYCATESGGDPLPMCYVGACHWCGKDGYGEEFTKWELVVSDVLPEFIGEAGSCFLWALSKNDGIVTAYKVWDDGNPVGDYYTYVGDVLTYFASVSTCETACIACDATAPIGACCLPDGSCSDMLQNDCDDAGGLYQGDGTTCAVEGLGCEPF